MSHLKFGGSLSFPSWRTNLVAILPSNDLSLFPGSNHPYSPARCNGDKSLRAAQDAMVRSTKVSLNGQNLRRSAPPPAVTLTNRGGLVYGHKSLPSAITKHFRDERPRSERVELSV
jgi:hypothetical protein